jgi:cell division protein FtsB
VKYLPHTLIVLIIAIQYPLWIGKGSWLRVWEVNKQLTEQKDKNTKLAERNAGLDADVRDLKEGLVAVEERARVELGMIKTNETFYQVIDRTKAASNKN